MPRLVRRAPLSERIQAYLDPADFIIWLSEELNSSDLEEFWETWGATVGFALNVAFFFAKVLRFADSDVFESGIGVSGWLNFMMRSASILLTGLSFSNAIYAMFRTRSYRLFEQNVETPVPTKSARRVRVDSSPANSSPLRYLTNIVSSEAAESRAHPDPSRDVWEVEVWDPTPICLTLFCLFSPGHIIVYWLLLPDNYDIGAYIKTFFLITLLSIQLKYLASNFAQQTKDNAVIHREVLHEYDTKFVHPSLNKPVRDVGIQTPPRRRDTATSSTMTTTEVDAYTPTTFINRGFYTNPNPAYASQYDPDSLSSQPEKSSRIFSRANTPLQTPQLTNGYSFPATSVATGASTQADFSSPIRARPTPRQPHFRATDVGSGTGDGGSLGVYNHAASPLRKAASTNYLREREASPRKRESSPLKNRISLPESGVGGPVLPSAAKERMSLYTNRGVGRRESSRFQ